MGAEEKVFVAVPAEPQAGQSTLSWALGNLYSSRATTIVVMHVHVPAQMIPISTCARSSSISPDLTCELIYLIKWLILS